MISIISAIYKSEKYLPAFLENVKKFISEVKNSGERVEIIIVPTNPSLEEKQLLDTVKNEEWCVIHEYNKPGLYAAWNEGFGIARGEIMGSWNVDDIRYANAVLEALRFVKNGADVVYFPFIIKRYFNIGSISIPILTKKISGEILNFEKRKFETTMTAGPHFMFTKKTFEIVGPFDEQFKIAGDFDWCARAASLNLHFACGKELSGIFRVDGSGLSSGGKELQVVENNIVYTRQKAYNKILKSNSNFTEKYNPSLIYFHNTKLPFK